MEKDGTVGSIIIVTDHGGKEESSQLVDMEPSRESSEATQRCSLITNPLPSNDCASCDVPVAGKICTNHVYIRGSSIYLFCINTGHAIQECDMSANPLPPNDSSRNISDSGKLST